MEAERIERLRIYLAEGRVIRHNWTGTDEQGRETACLLAALSPEAGQEGDSSACPAEVMPQWLAWLTPRLDDETSLDYWPSFVREYADAAARWHVLDDAAWRRVLARVMLAVLDVARPHDTSGAVERVADLWRRVMAGDEPGQGAGRPWPDAARAAARAAAEAAWAAEAASAAEAWDTIARAVLQAISDECDAMEVA